MKKEERKNKKQPNKSFDEASLNNVAGGTWEDRVVTCSVCGYSQNGGAGYECPNCQCAELW